MPRDAVSTGAKERGLTTTPALYCFSGLHLIKTYHEGCVTCMFSDLMPPNSIQSYTVLQRY